MSRRRLAATGAVTLLASTLASNAVGVAMAKRRAADLRRDFDADVTVLPRGHPPEGCRPTAAGGRFGDTPRVGAGPHRPVRLWALGDSAMAGDGIQTLERTLPVQTAQQLADRLHRPVAVTQLGVSGATTPEVITDQVPRLRGAHVDAIIVSCGVNDGLRRRRGRVVAADHRRLADALRATAPGAALVLVGAPDLRYAPGLPMPLRRIVGLLTGRIGRRQSAWLADTPVTVVEIGTPRAGFGLDGFHPGPLATPVIASRVVDHLAVALPGL